MSFSLPPAELLTDVDLVDSVLRQVEGNVTVWEDELWTIRNELCKDLLHDSETIGPFSGLEFALLWIALVVSNLIALVITVALKKLGERRGMWLALIPVGDALDTIFNVLILSRTDCPNTTSLVVLYLCVAVVGQHIDLGFLLCWNAASRVLSAMTTRLPRWAVTVLLSLVSWVQWPSPASALCSWFEWWAVHPLDLVRLTPACTWTLW